MGRKRKPKGRKNLICEWCGKFLTNKQKQFCCNSHARSGIKDSTRKKLSDASKVENLSEETRAKRSEAASNRKWTDEQRIARSEAYTGEGNPFYNKSHTENSRNQMKFTRQNYEYDSSAPQPEYRRNAIEAYGYKCSGCGCTEGLLHVHHVDGNHDNNNIDNLVVLCISCHGKIHDRLRNHGELNQEFTQVVLENRSKQ